MDREPGASGRRWPRSPNHDRRVRFVAPPVHRAHRDIDLVDRYLLRLPVFVLRAVFEILVEPGFVFAEPLQSRSPDSRPFTVGVAAARGERRERLPEWQSVTVHRNNSNTLFVSVAVVDVQRVDRDNHTETAGSPDCCRERREAEMGQPKHAHPSGGPVPVRQSLYDGRPFPSLGGRERFRPDSRRRPRPDHVSDDDPIATFGEELDDRLVKVVRPVVLRCRQGVGGE